MQRLLRTILFPALLVMGAAGLAAAETAVTDTAHEERVVERAEALYGQLLDKNIRHHRVREDIEPYFETHDARSNFLIRLAREVNDAGFADSRPRDVTIRLLEADPFYGTAETEARIEGSWFLWFTRSFTRVDTWTLVNGEWYLDAPPLRNLDFR